MWVIKKDEEEGGDKWEDKASEKLFTRVNN